MPVAIRSLETRAALVDVERMRAHLARVACAWEESASGVRGDEVVETWEVAGRRRLRPDPR